VSVYIFERLQQWPYIVIQHTQQELNITCYHPMVDLVALINRCYNYG